jgi:Tol biopolymer transport system component
MRIVAGILRRGSGLRTPPRLLAVAGAVLALSTVVSSGPGAVAAQPPAAPVTGRVLFAGTGHRSLGVVTGPGPSTPLLESGPTHFDDQPSARGTRLVFTSRRDSPTPQVYLRDADGTIRQLTTGRDAGHPQLSPDGASVVFDSAEPSPDGVGTQRDLWLVGSDGTGLRRLTTAAADETSPTFSPDGASIAFASDQSGTGEVYRQPVAGGPAQRLTTAGGATQPAWNPVDANVIAYSQDSGAGRQLRLIDGAESGIPVLGGASATWQSFSPAWRPDGNSLLFVSPDEPCGCIVDNVNRVYQVDTSAGVPVTSAPQLLLEEDRGDDSPTWFAGQLVVARTTSADQVTADLQDVLPDGTDPRDLGLSVLREDPGAATNADLLFNPGPGFDPWLERQNYSPDGTRIAVTRFETVDGRRVERIWLANADGSGAAPMPLADRGPADWETDPSWSPDGRFIVFTRQSPGGIGGPASRVFIVDVATGQVTGALPGADPTLSDAQPEWSPDGGSITFTRVANIGGSLANKHIWLASATALGDQRDLTAAICGANCAVVDDSPAFSPDGTKIAFNRKDDAVLLASIDGTDGTGCQVLLPAGANSCAGPIVAPSGPFQPRDVAFSPDGGQMVLTTRRAADPASPELLAVLDIASRQLTPITSALPGRQKEPSWQQTVDLAVTAPPSTPTVPTNGTETVTVTVTNHGPAPALGATLTLTVPPGLRLDGLRPDLGTCDPTVPRCDFGVLAPGQSVGVTATVTGTAPGAQRLTWSVTSAMQDSRPADNTAATVIPVETILASPALSMTVAPAPGYVGGAVAVTYTARNGNGATATGLRLVIATPAQIPVGAVTPGCTATGCPLPDLPPGTSRTVSVVLLPNAAVQTTVSGVLQTTGTDTNPADNAVTAPLRVLQPKIVAVPPIGKPGFVTSVRGTDFPPGAPVTLRWTPGITAAAVPTIPLPDGRFTAQLLILTKDETGPRVITASGPGFSQVTTPFLVVVGVYAPPDLVVRR